MADLQAALIRKVQPKLRMLANGSTEVNALRAEHASALVVPEEVRQEVAPRRDQGALPVTRSELSAEARKTDYLEELPNARVSVFVQLNDGVVDPAEANVPGCTARLGGLVTAELPVAEALALPERTAVDYIELGQPLALPTPLVTANQVGRPELAARRVGEAGRHRFAEGVLVGLIDVGGFDFAHPDFLDEHGGTRFVRIWDQGGDTHPSPAARGTSSLDYGAELRQEELNRAIEQSPSVGLPPQVLERQSQQGAGSHATHVASIAAGNRGVARTAFVAGVLVALPAEDEDRRLSFYDSSRVAHAVDYLLALAEELDVPVSINVSLGTNGHAHDDSAAVTRWIDAALVRPGVSVCVAAGNAGQERGETEDDVGWVMGRVHSSGKIAARGLVADVEWTVVGNTVVDISENELEIWYGPQDRLAVQIKPPGQPFTNPVEPSQFIENRQLPDGSFLSVYNELYHPANGANYISVYLSPLLREAGVVGVKAGSWVVRLLGREIRDGRYHCWIERDDPRRAGRVGEQEAWAFPSFFSERSMVDNSTISSLACGQRIVSVANLDEPASRINVSSSQGPTRDGRQKPDIAAPGTDIVAANGFAGDDAWIGMSGTSMASPYVAGTVALMLGANPRLTGAQISGILKRTARPLPGHDFTWRDDAGSGAIDPAASVREAATLALRKDVT